MPAFTGLAKTLSGAGWDARRKDCESVEGLMSPFIDSMVTPEDAARLESHVADCEPCSRHLQGLISVRNLFASLEPAAAPEDLVLDTRVRLSHERSRNDYDRWHTRLNNVLKPLAIPAVMGVSLTLLFFGVLFGTLAGHTVFAQDLAGPSVAVYHPLQTTDPTIAHFGSVLGPDLDEPLSIETLVSDAGRVFDYRIIAGARSADIDRWVRETLLLAQFRPATFFGKPVSSRIILSFVDVRS